jgi:hypothetical protein
VDTNRIDLLDLESRAFKSVYEETKRCACIRTRKDILVHEEAPDQIFILPRLTQARNLKEEHSVVIHHVVHLLKEGTEVADPDVFRHLKTGNFVVAAFGDGDITVVHAEDFALGFRDAGFA